MRHETTVRGLGDPHCAEETKFERFFELVQLEASKLGCVFFFDVGERNDFEGSEMDGEDLSGWLVPIELADEFEEKWLRQEEDAFDWFCMVRWSGDSLAPSIRFEYVYCEIQDVVPIFRGADETVTPTASHNESRE